MRRLLAIALASALLAAGCSASRSFTKKGDKLNMAGDYRTAADFYYNALLKKSHNIDARIGLGAAGQKVLDDYLQEFFKTHNTDQHKEAVYAWLSAKDYQDKLARFNVPLKVPGYYLEDFEESKAVYLADLYETAQGKLDDENFSGARALFDEIRRIDPDYKDAGDLQSLAVIEPKYRQAESAMERAAYRKAYSLFDDVFRTDPAYRDVSAMRQQALELGRFTIGFHRKDNRRYDAQANAIYGYVMGAINRQNDPFLRVVDRENLEKILKEQELSLSGIFSESDASDAGQLIGADAIFTGEVLSYKENVQPVQSIQRRGYERYTTKHYDKENDKTTYKTHYRPITYTEFHGSNEVNVSFRFTLTSLKTGEILQTDVVDRNFRDEVHYADGPSGKSWRNIYPAGANNKVNAIFSAKRKLDGLFKGERNLTPVGDLQQRAFESVAGKISDEIVRSIQYME